MLGILPDLTPRDSHSVWYTSSRNPSRSPFTDSSPEYHPRHQQYDQGDGDNGGNNVRRQGQAGLDRSPIVRLRADEQFMERRRSTIQNYGSTWLKPPGVSKTLHQIREERREAEEHAEAMRREQVQQELAEAEAAGFEMDEDAGESGDLDDMDDGARDLDEDIPDASAMDMGMSAIDEDTSDSSVSSSSVSSDDDGQSEDEDETESAESRQEQRRNELIQAHMRMADDAFRQALARGDADAGDMYDAEEELEAEGQGEILLEEVFRNARLVGGHFEDAEPEELNMDANLDDSIPEAGELSGVYEHTDSEAGLSSISSSSISSSGSEADHDEDMDFAPRSSIGGAAAALLRPPASPTLQARGDGARGHRVRQSMDLSSFLSGGDSSVLGSSPHRGPSRR
ncbi:hypothetical protein ACRALDRAFT_1082823 [Sodiomyces alcalophilus JCM 7366]|uniref:uncharacterized protein n=1 Tax=Sodiomyces alcalophilus JCM 7366 TaxID=591952 RepID=UPI0039B55BBC